MNILKVSFCYFINIIILVVNMLIFDKHLDGPGFIVNAISINRKKDYKVTYA